MPGRMDAVAAELAAMMQDDIHAAVRQVVSLAVVDAVVTGGVVVRNADGSRPIPKAIGASIRPGNVVVVVRRGRTEVAVCSIGSVGTAEPVIEGDWASITAALDEKVDITDYEVDQTTHALNHVTLQNNIDAKLSVEEADTFYYRSSVVDGKDAAIEELAWARPSAMPMVAGLYYSTFTHGLPKDGTIAGSSISAGQLRLMPFYVPEEQAFDEMGINITTAAAAGGKLRFGVFTFDLATKIATLVHDAGEVASDVATIISAATSFTLSPGRYWLGIFASATCSVHGAGVGSGIAYLTNGNPVASYAATGQTYGPFAATYTVPTTGTAAFAVFVRAA